MRAARAQSRIHTLLLMGGGLLVTIYVLAPFSWLVLTSFMHESDVLSVPPRIGWDSFTIHNYLTFIHASGIEAVVGSRAAENTVPGIFNSLVAATATAALNLVLGTLAGYSFARLRFPGRMPLLLMYLGSRMVPGIALIVPLYLTIKTFHLLDDLAGPGDHLSYADAAIHNLADEELFSGHPAVVGRGRPGGRL